MLISAIILILLRPVACKPAFTALTNVWPIAPVHIGGRPLLLRCVDLPAAAGEEGRCEASRAVSRFVSCNIAVNCAVRPGGVHKIAPRPSWMASPRAILAIVSGENATGPRRDGSAGSSIPVCRSVHTALPVAV